MSMQFNQKPNKKKNNGFYAAITLCCAAVCLVAWSTALSNRSGDSIKDSDIKNQQTGNAQRWMTEDEAGGEPASALTQSTTPTTLAGTLTTTNQAPATTQVSDQGLDTPAAAPAQKITPPIEKGSVIKPFSVEELLFNATMGDWRVHQGADISASDGAKVRAVIGGTVAEVMEDVLYGHTVVISHADGSMLYYSGLTAESPVSKGQKVASGDTIGIIGIVPCESADGPHLHLSLMKNGVFADPIAAFGLK